MADPRWVELAALDDIPPDRPATIKVAGHQLAVVRDGERFFAVDNRCPHEGYPLASGQVAGNVLTCEWHNWKFELGCPSAGGGRCILGGEDVRAYAVRRDGDRLFVDLAPPPDPTDRLVASLTDAFEEADWGWGARVIERLLGAGIPALEIAGRAVIYASERSPYGFDHGLATAADLAALLGGSAADGELVLEACHAMVMPNLRRPPIARVEAAAEPATEG